MQNENESLLAKSLQGEGTEGSIGPLPSCLSAQQKQLWANIESMMEQWRVHRDEQVGEERYLLEYKGVRCFPRGDVIAITGREKCGKTTVCRIFATAALRGEYLGFRCLESGLRVLWIDTEQFRADSHKMLRGIEMMCGRELTDDELELISLRGQEMLSDWPTLQLSLNVLFNAFRPDLAIIDGIRDYIADFNDVEQSAEIVLRCMSLANGVSEEEARRSGLHPRKPCCILANLHLNKPKDDNNMMGHLGSTLAKKAGEIYTCIKNFDERTFSVTQSASRSRPWEHDFEYAICTRTYDNGKEVGIPEVLEKATETKTASAETKEQPAPNERTYYASTEEFLKKNSLRKVFADLIESHTEVRATELQNRFLDRYAMSFINYNNLRQMALDEHIIYRSQPEPLVVLYRRYEDYDPSFEPDINLNFEG